MAELEESRRKLVNLKMQKDVASGMNTLASGAGAVNGNVSPEKPSSGTMDIQELNDSIEEAQVSIIHKLPLSLLFFYVLVFIGFSQLVSLTKQILQILAVDRLSELKDAQQDIVNLSKQVQSLEVCMIDM